MTPAEVDALTLADFLILTDALIPKGAVSGPQADV